MPWLLVISAVVAVVVLALYVAMQHQHSRALTEIRTWEHSYSRRLAIEDELRKKYPNVLVLPAWDVVRTTPISSKEYVVYTVAEDDRELPEQVAKRIVSDVSSGQARSRVVPRVEGL